MKHRERAGAPEERLTGGGPVVALLERRGRFLVAEPFFFRGRRMSVDRPRAGQAAKPGDLVLVSPNGPRSGHAKILRRLGSPDVARDVIEAMLLDRGLKRRFDPHVEREARAAAERPPEDEAAGRLDLRALPTFTIDPPTARDFDDAISAEALDGGAVRVWVHIADVSHYVKPGSPVDREAFRRATSVYVPGTVEPMLPEVLSNGACSLVPHQDRLAVTVELEFDGADVRRTAFHRSDHPLRRAARLPAGRPDLRRRGGAAAAVRRAAGRGARASPRRCRTCASGAARSRSSPRSPSSRSRATATSRSWRGASRRSRTA